MSTAFWRCELDDWDYDPRYTEGACPICGTRPPGAPVAPRWLLLSRRVPWDLVFLFALFALLLVFAVVVVQASGLAAGWHLPKPPHLRR